MSNPLRDYFARAARGLLKDFAREHAVAVHVSAPPGGARTVLVGGFAYSLDNTLNIVLRTTLPVVHRPYKVWILAFHYRLDPTTAATVTGSIGAKAPDELRSRERPWPWLPAADPPFAVCFVQLEGDGDTFSLDLEFVHAQGTAAPATSAELSHFHLYEVDAIDLDLTIVRPAPGPGPATWPSKSVVTGHSLAPAQRIEMWDASDGLGTRSPYEVRLAASSRGGASLDFVTVVHPVLSVSDNGNVSAFVFPLQELRPGVDRLNTALEVFALLDYLALLDAYAQPLDSVLSLERVVQLDAGSAMLFPPAGLASFAPLAPLIRRHRFAARLKAFDTFWQVRMGGAAFVSVAQQLCLAQRLGQSAAFIDSGGPPLGSRFADFRSYGVTLLRTNCQWWSFLETTTAGPLAQAAGLNDLGKNPLQLDVLQLHAAAQAVVDENRDLAQWNAPGDEWILHTTELGDTNMGRAFTLARSVADIANVNVTAAATGKPYSYHLGGELLEIENVTLEPDQQYQAGFVLHLYDDYIRQRVRALTAPSGANLIRLVDDRAKNLDGFRHLVAVSPGTSAGIDQSDHGAAFTGALATNGMLDSFPWDFGGGFAVTPITSRMPAPGAAIAERRLWYCAMRYWNVANIAYLANATGLLQRATRAPQSTSISKPLGYWFGSCPAGCPTRAGICSAAARLMSSGCTTSTHAGT